MQDQQTMPTGISEAWLRLPLALSPQAERLIGANHEQMLYLEAGRRYIRLSQGAARLLDALDGQTTGAEILAQVGGHADPVRAQRRRQAVLATIETLRTAGAFTIEADFRPTAGRGGWRQRLALPPKLTVTRRIDAVVSGPAALVVRHPRTTRLTLVALAVASIVLIAAAVSQFSHAIVVFWPVVPAIVLLTVAAHELGHAVVCRALGVPVREAGIMLWGWFLPLVYVDCTDMYRLPARRLRVMVALAGPYVDLATAGACAAVGLSTSGELSGSAFIVLVVQLVVLARNLTPFLLSDGYHAMEAALGELNLRHRSWVQLQVALQDLRHRLLGSADLPTEVVSAAGPKRTPHNKAYVAYAMATVVYTVAMFAFVVTAVPDLIRAVD